MTVGIINILDMIEEAGEEAVNVVISDFSTKRAESDKSLNEDIEIFLKKNAIQFAKEKKSVTYLVCDRDDGSLLGYFTIAHKALEIPSDGLSKTSIKVIERYAQHHKNLIRILSQLFLLPRSGRTIM